MVRLGRKWSLSFVLRLCWQAMWFFFHCAQLGQKLWTNSAFQGQAFFCCGLLEKWKFKMPGSSRKLCQSFVLSFFLLCYTPPQTGGQNPPIYGENSKCLICAKIVSIVCSSFVVAAYVIFSLVLLLFSNWDAKSFVYTWGNFKCLIGAKLVSIIFASFVLEGYVIFSIVLLPRPTREAKTPPIHSKNWKWCVWWENGVNRLFFVCAGWLYYFPLIFMLPYSTQGAITPGIYGGNWKWCDWCENVSRLGFVYASLCCNFFRLCYTHSQNGVQNPLYM